MPVKKKYLILLCLAALSLSLSGCGNKEDDATIGSLDVSMSTEDIEASGEAETSEEESESESETELETITIPETTREASESLPDVAIMQNAIPLTIQRGTRYRKRINTRRFWFRKTRRFSYIVSMIHLKAAMEYFILSR